MALPSEHGSWGLALEPLVLGLLIAPSLAGLGLALGLLAAFLAHQPFQTAWRDRRKGKRYPRTRAAEVFVALYLAVSGFGGLWALVEIGWGPFLPLVLALPLGLLFVGASSRGEMHTAGVEILASLALAAGATAVALAGDASPWLAWALWPLVAARSVPAVLYVRARLRLERGESPPRIWAIGAHAVGLVLAGLVVLWTPVPALALAAVTLLLLRALWGLSRWRRPARPWKVGLAEIGWGILFVLLIALGGCSSFGTIGSTEPSPTEQSQAMQGREVRPMRFRVLTFNTLKFGGPVPPERVMDRMLELEPDVILLQEVFNTRRIRDDFRALDAQRLLTERLEGDFHVAWMATSGPRGVLGFFLGRRFRDGLMIAARKDRWDFGPRRDHHTRLFPALGRFNVRGTHAVVLTGRGGTGAGAEAGDAPRVLVANTHLTRGTDAEHVAGRREQATELQRFVAELERETGADGVIVGGDFNAPDGDPVIQELAAQFRDSFREIEPDAPGFTFDVANTLVGERPEGSERIDYLWLRSPGNRALHVHSASVVLDEPDPETGQNLSDHYGLLAELEISGR